MRPLTAIVLACCLAVAIAVPVFPPQFSFFFEEATGRTDVVWDANNDRVAVWSLQEHSSQEISIHTDLHFWGAGYEIHADNLTVDGHNRLMCCHDNDTKANIGPFWTATNQSTTTECGGLKNLTCWNGTPSGIERIPFAVWCFASNGEPACSILGKFQIVAHAYSVGAPAAAFTLPTAFGTCNEC